MEALSRRARCAALYRYLAQARSAEVKGPKNVQRRAAFGDCGSALDFRLPARVLCLLSEASDRYVLYSIISVSRLFCKTSPKEAGQIEIVRACLLGVWGQISPVRDSCKERKKTKQAVIGGVTMGSSGTMKRPTMTAITPLSGWN